MCYKCAIIEGNTGGSHWSAWNACHWKKTNKHVTRLRCHRWRPSKRRRPMKRKKSISIGALSILVLLAFAGSGCSRNCPKDGTWVTGDTEGLTSLEVKNCGIPFAYYTVTIEGTQNSGRIGLLDTCRISADQSFNCHEQGYANPRWTFIGKFTGDTAEGQFSFNKGSQWDFGVIPEEIKFDWKASLSQ
jgi:hypothetical protein